eukprot:493771-Amphidinium_carterae.1
MDFVTSSGCTTGAATTTGVLASSTVGEVEHEEIKPQKKSSATTSNKLQKDSKASASVQLHAKPKAQTKVLVKKIERLRAKRSRMTEEEEK